MSNKSRIWQIILIPLVLIIFLIFGIFFIPPLRVIFVSIYSPLSIFYGVVLMLLAFRYPPSPENSALRFIYFIGPLIFIIISFFGLINSSIETQVELWTFWLYTFIILINLYVWLIISAISGKKRKNLGYKGNYKYVKQLGESKEMEKFKGDFKQERIILKSRGANNFGQECKGVAQIRGNGNLILYESFLYFKYWILKKEIFIPIKNIKGIEITNSHLKKISLRPLLKVIFINDMGQLDSVAWWVRKLNLWVSSLEQKLS